MARAYIGPNSSNDNYQSSVSTNYSRDQTTGQLFLTSGSNVRTIIPEMFKNAVLVMERDSEDGGTQNIYTVPAGYNFIMSVVSLSINWSSALVGTNNYGDVLINNNPLIRLYGCQAIHGALATNLTPSNQLVFRAGDVFEILSSSANLRAFGSIIGYIIPQSDCNF